MEIKVQAHHIAQERRRQGKPIWDRKVFIKHILRDETLGFEKARDTIVRILQRSQWAKGRDDELTYAIEMLADADDHVEFEGWMHEIYDIADIERTWIA